MPETLLCLGWPQKISPWLWQAWESSAHKPGADSFGGHAAEPGTAMGASGGCPGGMPRWCPQV